MTARFSRRLFGIALVVVSVLSTPLNAFSRRRSQLDTVYQPHSRRSYVRVASHHHHHHHASSSCIITMHYLTGPQYLTDCLSTVFTNVNSCSRSLYAVARPSVVCLSVGNARAPCSGRCNFRQYFYGIWYVGHPLTSTKKFTEIVPGPLRRGELNTRGVAKYSDFHLRIHLPRREYV